jgi:hypothetical protein
MVREVFARVAGGDSGAADLYSEDGVIQVPGHEVRGREAIRDFYQVTIDAMHPRPEVRDLRQVGDLIVVVVHVPHDEGVQDAIDLFEVGESEIRRLVIFPSGG